MSYILLLIILILNIGTLNISSLNINFFNQEKKLYYVNAMNNDNGDIYLEFWGEDNKIRYFIGIDYINEGQINFNENKIYSIETNEISKYHDSIIVNNNNEINIFSMNYEYFSFINIKDSNYTSKETKDIIFENNGEPSQRNSIIKLKDNTYLLSIILHKGGFIRKHYINFRIFKFKSNDISGYEELEYWDKNINRLNSTSCIQTESQNIQCIIPKRILDGKKAELQISIFDSKLEEKNTISFSNVKDNSFTKIFHIKDEIAGYIFFDYSTNIPILYIKKLIANAYELGGVISGKENIIENIGYDIDISAFSSDAIKIDDSRFVIFFTIKSTYKLLLCLFDFNEEYTGIRLRKYVLDFDSINIRISVNLRSFLFKDYFGLLFYDSGSEYPGYLFFNYINITSNNKIDSRTIIINDFKEYSSITFSFLENLEFTNIIYNGPIKIRIESFSSKDESSILTKSSKTNSEISIGDILDINDNLIFEKDNEQLHDYFLKFLPIVQEIDSNTEIFGNYEENDFEQIGYFTKYVFNIIIPSGKNCSEEDFIYMKNEQEKYCLTSCDSYKEKQLYQDERENICYNDCSEAKNGNIYTFFLKCVLNCPIEYIPNENNICIPNETIISTNINIEEDITDNIEKKSETNLIEDNMNGKLDEKDELNELIKNFGDIGSLINEYRKKDPALDLKQEDNSSFISYSYSDDMESEILEKIFPNLTLININDCKNKLFTENIIDNKAKIIIKGRQDKNDFNNFEYELYLDNGTILNKSLCESTKIEISKPIDPNILETAKALSDQGYDMFNLSSNLYSDNCISVELNDCDVTLGTRQKDIMPEENSFLFRE